jgi:hypothetical protein
MGRNASRISATLSRFLEQTFTATNLKGIVILAGENPINPGNLGLMVYVVISHFERAAHLFQALVEQRVRVDPRPRRLAMDARCAHSLLP